MKRALVIAPLSPPITGQQQASVELIQTLQKVYEVDTVDYSKSNFRPGNFSVDRLVRMLAAAFRIRVRSNRAAVTYLTVSQSLLGNLRDLLFMFCSRSDGLIIHLHGSGIGTLLFSRFPLLRTLNRMAGRKVDRAIVLSESLKRNYARVLPPERLIVVPGFVDRASVDEHALLAKYDSRKLKVLYLSNLIEAKGYLDVLEGYLGLEPEVRAVVELDFAGKCEGSAAETEFRRRIASLPTVRYWGVVTHKRKRELLANAHLLCLPSYYPYEGQPVVILEAYSYGCVVATTRQGGICDIFDDGTNGILIEPREPMSVTAAIREVVHMDRDLRGSIAERNIRCVRERFSREAFEQNVLQVFHQVTENSAKDTKKVELR